MMFSALASFEESFKEFIESSVDKMALKEPLVFGVSHRMYVLTVTGYLLLNIAGLLVGVVKLPKDLLYILSAPIINTLAYASIGSTILNGMGYLDKRRRIRVLELELQISKILNEVLREEIEVPKISGKVYLMIILSLSTLCAFYLYLKQYDDVLRIALRYIDSNRYAIAYSVLALNLPATAIFLDNNSCYSTYAI